MKNILKRLLAIFLGVIIIISSFLIFSSLLIKNTLLSENFYKTATGSPNYILMLRQSIGLEFDAQSRFSGIPLDYFKSGLSDELISEMQKEHIKNSVLFLSGKADYKKAEYPLKLFMDQFEKFIETAKEENEGFETNDNLYTQLEEVAEDSAGIVEKHVNILRFDVIKNNQIFKKFHNVILMASKSAIPASFLLLIATSVIFYIYRKKIGVAIFLVCTSFWIFGAAIAIPGIVIKRTGITQRLAINTTYFKFSIDTWLGKINDYILITGACFFIISSAILIIWFFRNQFKK